MKNHTKKQNLHGTLLKIFDTGVLISGEPGSGKSDLALALLDRGHDLIADDCVDIFRNETHLEAECPSISQHFLLIHHVGLVNIHKLYPQKEAVKHCDLQLIVKLISPEQLQKNNEPLSPITTHREILGLLIPEIHLPANKNRPMPLLVETLVKNWLLKKAGYDIVKDFHNRENKSGLIHD